MHTLIRRSACFIAILLFSGLTMGVQPALAVDCSQAQINLTTQAEVDSFQADYGPGCDTVINGLIIDGASINDLTPLSDLTAVATIGPFYPTHQLLITNTSLTSLAGLENLANIFWLDLSNNNQLTSLAALSNLTLVRGPITISGSSVLTNVNGLGGVTALNGGALILRDNPLLSDLSGLSNLTTTGASLVINNNDSLQHVDGLSGLNFVASNISIGYNDGLLNIDGLGNIANFDATFDLRFNSQLVSIPTFTGWTDLFGLILYYNAELQHVDGLLGLETIGNQYSTMWIRNNAKLSSLDGLADLVSLDAGLELSGNPMLGDCDGLIKLLDLTDDALPGPGPGATGIPDVRLEVLVENNDVGCNSITEITGESPPPPYDLDPDFGGLDNHFGAFSQVNPDDSCDWEPGETVEFWWTAPEVMLDSIEVDEKGCFEAFIRLDSEKVGGAAVDTYVIEARGSTSGTSQQNFRLVEPQLNLSPAQGAPGSEVDVTGCNWDGAAEVNVTWLGENIDLGTLPVDGFGCIDDSLQIPNLSGGIYSIEGESDNALVTRTAFKISSPEVSLFPPESPPGAKIIVAGCNWFPDEIIEFEFQGEEVVFSLVDTNGDGCLTNKLGGSPFIEIPETATLGEKSLIARGQTSNLVVDQLFVVREPTLSFTPDEGLIGDPITVSGCGWAENASVTVTWGHLDHNNQEIKWNANVDPITGCFGQNLELVLNIPADSTTGPIELTAEGDVSGQAMATLTVNHNGFFYAPNPDAYAGYAVTLKFENAIFGEQIGVQIAGNPTTVQYVTATAEEFTFDYLLPTNYNVGNDRSLSATGSKGFSASTNINILDNAEISVFDPENVKTGRPLKVEGNNWGSYEVVIFSLVQGMDETRLYPRAEVPAGEISFTHYLDMPSSIPPGEYILLAEGSRGRDAELAIKVDVGPPAAFTLGASYAETPPSLDGRLSRDEWDYSNRADLPNGFITVRSDETRLYILLDLLNDSSEDPVGTDGFWLSFDVWQDLVIDADWDLNFRIDSSGELIVEEYKGPNSFNLRPMPFNRSITAAGFGCFVADGTNTIGGGGFPPDTNCDRHRIFEIAIDLPSILAQPGDNVRMGIRTLSGTPSFTDNVPANFVNDFTNLATIALADSQFGLVPPNGMVNGIGQGGFELEVTQSIQDADNSLQLVADKTTAVRVYTDVAAVALVHTYLYGERNGSWLPASPLVSAAILPAIIERDDIAHTSNFLLPASWVAAGTTKFYAVTENAGGQNSYLHTESIIFNEQAVPEYWIIPINSAAVGNPPALVANDLIASQQSFLETVFPLHDVNWVRKPWTEIGALPIGNQEAKNWLPDVNDALNDYYDDLMITHSEKLEETGVEPFNLPDQIYGFTARGGGLSDPAKYNGERRVSSGFFGTSGPLTMAHEINHNLDSVSPRTWGKHTTDADDDTDNNNWGCGAEGGNTDWPRMNDEIGEIGFDTRLPWQESGTVQLTVIPNNWPDLMSYCRSAPESNALPNQEPFKWTSEYRWEKHYLKFRPPSPFELGVVIPPELVYYVSGTLTAVDAGSLDPVRTLPGIPSTNITPGDWSLEVQNVGGSVLWATTFDVSFISEEGDELTEVRFRYRVPTQETAAKIVLKHLGSTIDTLEASANAPVINITTPSGGETWGDSANVVWTASDADDDDLSFTLFYSPDDGERWFPVARNLLGTEHEFATTGLPGGTQGKLRLVATDGFHTVIAVSMGYFTVSDAEPSVVIESPLAGKIYRPREWITMRGSASLPGNDGGGLSFAWFLDDELLDVGDQFSAQFDEGDYALMLVAWDEDGNFGTADISLLVFEDDPPNEPILPLPHDGTSGTVIDPTLSWLGGDPDGNAVTYDVLLDAGNPNPTTLVCDDALVSECLPAFPLVPETMYYWKVVARDDTGLETHGQIWSFTTGQYNSLEVIFGDGFE